MTLLRVSNLTKYYGTDLVFEDASFQVARGEKVALVGVNGAGKSTLLRIIAGLEEADRGEVQALRGTRVAFLAQEAQFDSDRTLWEEMEAALAQLDELQAEISELERALDDTSAPDWAERMERYGELTARFEHAGGYDREHNTERTLHRLGFIEAQFGQPMRQMSGGQKTRAALAAALLSDPDLLLLDEPTNHLDLEAMEWLDDFLRTWPGTLIVVSHDRRFLDKATKRTLELVLGKVEDYPGGYNRYLQLKAERMERRMKEFVAQQKFIARTEEFIRRYKAGQRSREARGRETRLNRLKAHNLLERPEKMARLNLSLESQLRSGDVVLALDRLEVGFRSLGPRESGDAPTRLVRADKLELRRGERVALLGPNGGGKTTLLRTIMGELRPLAGRPHLGHNVAVGYYAQGHEGLNWDATVLQEVLRADPKIGEAQARNLLGRFLFSGDDVFKQIADLSGGERSRVALARLTLSFTNMLILDEPTNHLDIDAREALEAVLGEYDGSILFVSHDRYFIDALAEKIWVIENGILSECPGNYTAYMANLEKERQAVRNGKSAVADGEAKGSVSQKRQKDTRSRSERETAAGEHRQRHKLGVALEAELVRMEQELVTIKAEMEAASSAQDVAKITELGLRYVEMQEHYNRRCEEWATLETGVN